MKQPLLSICIPSEGNVKWAMPTIESFYQDNLSFDLYEVICTDNGTGSDLSEAVKGLNYPNFHYFKTTSKGYVNQIDAFERSTGLFCKMQNSRSPLLPGMLQQLLNLAERYKNERPIIFCSNHALRFKEDITEYDTLDSFVRALDIFSTWSGGVCAWREDIDALRGAPYNETFPHVRYLYDVKGAKRFVIYNQCISKDLSDEGKGGTNPFRDFLLTYPGILKELLDNERISTDTFENMQQSLFRFMTNTYANEVLLPTKHAFDLSGLRDSMSIWYGDIKYYQLKVNAFFLLPKIIWGRWKKRLRMFAVKTVHAFRKNPS